MKPRKLLSDPRRYEVMLCISAAQQDQAGASSYCQRPHREMFETASVDKAILHMLQYVVNVVHCGCD